MASKLKSFFGSLCFFLGAGMAVDGQVSNKPSGATQVPAPTGIVAPTPTGYLINGQAPLVNYVRERDAMGRITDTIVFGSAGYVDVKETTNYFDGLGRPLQTVQRQITPGNNPVDVVAPVVYDQYGRETYKYLPYAASSNNASDGGLKLDPFTDQKNFYQNVYPTEQPAYTGEQVYYGQTNFEASPLNRVLQTLAPGNSWAGSGNGVSQQYLVNSPADSVVMWHVGADPLTYLNNDVYTNIPVDSGFYADGALYKNISIDEQGHAVVEYRDKDNLVVLKKVQIGTVATDFSGYTGWLSTYYVYDDLNQLRFVLSPKAVRIVYGHGWNVAADTTTISELCFRYEYDGRQRMIAKRVPGSAWQYMVYDARDRLVFNQDGNLRNRNWWAATLYDGLNRQASTGMVTYSGTRDQLQVYVTANTGNSTVSPLAVSGSTPSALPQELDLSSLSDGDQQAQAGITLDNGFQTPDVVNFTAEIVAGGTSGRAFSNSVSITDNPVPTGGNFIPLTLTFYDDYSNTPEKQYTAGYNATLDGGTNQHIEVLPGVLDQPAVQTIGLTTAVKVRVLEDPSDLTKGNWLTTASFYDDRARVVQTQADNYKGGQDTVVSLFNFTGQVVCSYLAHGNPAASFAANIHIKTANNYDHANRLLEVYKTINDADTTKRLISRSSYDQLGLLKQKQIGQLLDNSFLETQDFAYNIRGWLKGINRDYANNDNSRNANDRWFGMDLSYDWGFGTNQVNGNMSGNAWRSKGDGQQRAYGYGYDFTNRILYADFNQHASGGWDKSTGIDFSSVMGDGVDPFKAYDENGNIRGMQQSGWQLGGSHLIDALTYNYIDSSNKLKNVIDGSNDPNTKLGDFRTSALSPYNSGKTAAAVDYAYDVNGNLLKDLNKDIGTASAGGIVYNHLNLPWQITFQSASGTKGTITYIYDASGNKLEKRVADNQANLQTSTTYIEGFQYQGRQPLSATGASADTFQFFGHEEGRVRIVNDTTDGQSIVGFKYDYFLKDHLGNTRMVLTDEQQTDRYIAATMELSDSAQENLYYSGLDTRVSLPPGYPTDTTTNPNNYVAEVDGSTGGHKVGPGILLKVMAGDQFSVRASSWYRLNGATPATPVSPLPDLLTTLISGVAGLPGGEHPSLAMLNANPAPLSNNLSDFLNNTDGGAVPTKPRAFVNWVLFDNQFNYVEASSGFDQVADDQVLKKHILANLPVTKSGYLYIYTSNETPNVSVFFDNLQVTHTRGPLLEEDHYYPFGLTMAGISDKAVKTGYAENKYKFQKQELQSNEFADGGGLDTYEFKYRMDDPQTGRFWSIDPLADKYVYNSTYAFSENKVTGDIELEGAESLSLQSLWRAAGISSSSDPKKFVANVGKEALKPKNWLYGYAAAGQIIAPLALTAIMTDGVGEGAVLRAEIEGFSLDSPGTFGSLSDASASGSASDASAAGSLPDASAAASLSDPSAAPSAAAGDASASANAAPKKYVDVASSFSLKANDVSETTIKNALLGSNMNTTQNSISLPAVQRYVSRLQLGETAPPIKVAEGNVIVDGNHRYVAGRVLGQEPATVPGTMSSSQAAKVKPIQQIKVDPTDWGNH